MRALNFYIMLGRDIEDSISPMSHLDVESSDVIPSVSIVRLLLGASCERLHSSAAVPGPQVAVAQRKPALRVQRVDGQCQLPVLCCLQNERRE